MLSIENVSVRFESTNAVDGVSLTVNDGERLSILGPSGSGKSTLLRAIAGLEPLAAGRLTWDGNDLADIPVHRRGFGLMFQDYVLFPHLDVAANVRFGLDVTGDDRAERLGNRVGLEQRRCRGEGLLPPFGHSPGPLQAKSCSGVKDV